MADIPPTAFVPVPGQANTTLVQISGPATLAPALAPAAPLATPFIPTIQTAIADNDAANTPGTTALPPPNNFQFTDLTVNVSLETAGDTFKGTTPGITAQFLDLTPDNLLLTALNPNVFMRSDTGTDVLIAQSGRNILSGGSGDNLFVGGSGTDTFLADATTASTADTFFNFHSGDDLAVIGAAVAAGGFSSTDYHFSLADTLNGLEIDAVPLGAPATAAASIVLPGHTVSEIGSKLSLGLSATSDGRTFLFVHGN